MATRLWMPPQSGQAIRSRPPATDSLMSPSLGVLGRVRVLVSLLGAWSIA